MTGPEALDALVALGGLGGVAATITSLATLVKTRRVQADAATTAAQVVPDHGTSMRDEIQSGFRRMDHQFGEIQERLTQEQEDRRQGDETLRHMIESRPMGYPWDK